MKTNFIDNNFSKLLKNHQKLSKLLLIIVITAQVLFIYLFF